MHVKYLQTELLQHLHLQRNRTKTSRRDAFDYDSNSTVGPACCRNAIHLSSVSVLVYSFILSLRSYRAKVHSRGRSKGKMQRTLKVGFKNKHTPCV